MNDHRVIIENIQPRIDEGRFPIRRAVGESVVVEADIFADGHDVLAAELAWRQQNAKKWTSRPMAALINDRWRGEFVVEAQGVYVYKLHAWIDRFQTWRHGLSKKIEAGQDVSVELQAGAALADEAAGRASAADAAALRKAAKTLGDQSVAAGDRHDLALGDEILELMTRYPDRQRQSSWPEELEVVVERPRARYSSWYEMFPRSTAAESGRHGTFKDCIERLPYVAGMGFDVLYLPPIHPIGETKRKGPNNATTSRPGDPGSPWAIGSKEGGHTAIHPDLGTPEEFRELIGEAAKHGIEIAMDMAFQCSPDHPWVREHPDWFRHRPDGSIQYAENPPKKYEDIYPLDFESPALEELQNELLGVFRHWINEGIRIFRVDNPHTKSLPFWEWIIGRIKAESPDVIFLAEAFTRPKVMYRLAKAGFTQSYTYFTWRNFKWEIEQYFHELNDDPVREIFWPNLWPNTPDILPEFLQYGGRPAFITRLVLAATLSSSYGIYGPTFELCVAEPREPFSEEYRDSEKYQIHHWELEQPHSLRSFIGRVNRIRRENPALQQNRTLMFHTIDREQLICFSKHTADLSNIILVVANLDPHNAQSGWLRVPLEIWGMEGEESYQVHDLISGARYLWHSQHNYVELRPGELPAHIFRIRRRVRTEHDFDYFM